MMTHHEHVTHRVGEAVDDLRHRVGGSDHGKRSDDDSGGGSRLLWFALGLGVGAAAVWFADPSQGRQRRQEVAAGGRDVADDLGTRARYTAGQAHGVVAETADALTPQEVPDDPKLLRQKVRSEVFGARDDVQDVVIRVDGPGRVALKGTVPTPSAEASLIAEVEAVDGVVEVTSELSHRRD